jgi:hypothetical protein
MAGYFQMFLRNNPMPPGYCHRVAPRRPKPRLNFISTNTARHIQSGAFSATPEIPPEMSSSGDAPPVP